MPDEITSFSPAPHLADGLTMSRTSDGRLRISILEDGSSASYTVDRTEVEEFIAALAEFMVSG